jgi:hypothetical protein
LRIDKHFLSIALIWTVVPTAANPQKPAVSAPGDARGKAVASPEVSAVIAQRRQTAIALLTSLAVEARSYRDETLRGRVQARVADALWDTDWEASRDLFRRAWAAAETAGTDQARNDQSATVPGRTGRNSTPKPRTNLRAEILTLAASRDRALGEEFLAKLTGSKNDARNASDASKSTPDGPLSQAEISERLKLANQFLESSDIERALQFADPALTQATGAIICFLVSLRDKDPMAADQRFAAVLGIAAMDPASDANTVSALTSYAFTPSLFVVVSDTGIPSGIRYSPKPAPNLAPDLRKAFFESAASILLRPIAVLDQTSAGRAGTYFIAKSVFPLFQQYAPDLAPAISAQLAALGGDSAPGPTNDVSDRSRNRHNGPDGVDDSVQEDLQNRLDSARTADERDRAYAFAAMRAADAGEMRAMDLADKIEDHDTRNGVRRFVDYSLIGGFLRKKKAEEAIRLARKSDLTHTQRAHVLTQAAALLVRADPVRAGEVFDEALTEARRIDAATPDRAYMLVALMAQFTRTNRARAWDLAGETVKAANSVSGFTGENGSVSSRLEGKFSISMGTELATASDLPDAFLAFAKDDLYQAINISRTFAEDAPRALVTLAIARAVLDKKQASTK